MQDAQSPSWMPRWQCHKIVKAFKISSILSVTNNSSANLISENREYGCRVDEKYLSKHKPEVGGYYVYYDDGYESFSPEKAFEDGYTKINEPAVV